MHDELVQRGPSASSPASCDSIDDQLLALLACPRDRGELRIEDGHLCCSRGHRYPIVNGVPVLLLAEKQQTIGLADASLKAAASRTGHPLYVETLGLSSAQKREVERTWRPDGAVDAAISYVVGATSGRGYANSIGRLTGYPIPDIPLGAGSGRTLLDVGSGWGRWSVSAAQKGWRVVGIDPSLGAVMAARRAFSGRGLTMAFVCGDARYLPFPSDRFDCAFSYSVVQHFSESDAATAVAEMARVLRQGGCAKIQMAHKGGLRSTYSRTRPGYAHSGAFRVRYWSLPSLRLLFEERIGSTTILAEGFGGLGLLPEDWRFVSNRARMLIAISTVLKKLSAVASPLTGLADSVYVVARKR